ncbi:hypothetical protein CGLO_12283 [Colletotrichum gloeosporioides Cg-14]|uniref:Uncharacterized protein n=1 Tax=Colletotrichum gloeosporioides (strain Cg-14) TaxID=1237896 RepID=T0K691_COLGC|nr:hypothetical protein CGLO_12283 [Colletotrichum gloeosporioides Cg-14]
MSFWVFLQNGFIQITCDFPFSLRYLEPVHLILCLIYKGYR